MKLFITGHDGFIGKAILPKITSHQIGLLQSDLRDTKKVEQEIIDFDPTHVLHLGALSEVAHSFSRPLDYAYIDYIGTINLIESIQKNCKNFQHFLFPSTMEVYGWQTISDRIKNKEKFNTEIFDENTIPNPNSPYAISKLACEKYLEYMYRTKGFPFTAVRQTNTYGRTENDFFITEAIITRMLKNSEKIVVGDIEPYRNFLHVDDLIRAWLTILENPKSSIGKIYTVGPNNPIQIKDYIKIIQQKLNWKGIIEQNTEFFRTGEIYWLNSDCAQIRKDLGFEPIITIDQGLDRTIAHWKNVIRKN